MLLDDPRALELFHKAGELKCPVVLHLDVPYLPDENGKQVYQTYWYGGGTGSSGADLAGLPRNGLHRPCPRFLAVYQR